MAKIKYKSRMREIDRLADALSDAVNALRRDIYDAGDDATVHIKVWGGETNDECVVCRVEETRRDSL